MLIGMRNAMMAGKRLPYDAEVEYLECGKGQFFWSGVMCASALKVEFKCSTFQLSSSAGIGFHYGIFGDTSATVITHDWVGFHGVGNRTVKTMLPVINTPYECSVDFGNRVIIRDGTVIYNGSSTSTPAYTTNYEALCLRKTSNGVFAEDGLYGRCYYFRIYLDNILVRDFIPVRKGSVGYMYDRVSGKLFGNAGSGDFVLGPDVVPVEYIESHGTEYIDTGVSPYGRSPSILLDMTSLSTSAPLSGYFGAWGLNNTRLQVFRGNNATGSLGLGTYSNISWVDNVRTTVKLDAPTRSAEIYGNTYTGFDTSNGFANFNLYLFWRNNNNGDGTLPGKMRCYSCKIGDNSTPVRSFRPVRVGTDATSCEGAMMDVLTRRIYRNAGTGAFGYGNDLKYPIPAE